MIPKDLEDLPALRDPPDHLIPTLLADPIASIDLQELRTSADLKDLPQPRELRDPPILAVLADLKVSSNPELSVTPAPLRDSIRDAPTNHLAHPEVTESRELI